MTAGTAALAILDGACRVLGSVWTRRKRARAALTSAGSCRARSPGAPFLFQIAARGGDHHSAPTTGFLRASTEPSSGRHPAAQRPHLPRPTAVRRRRRRRRAVRRERLGRRRRARDKPAAAPAITRRARAIIKSTLPCLAPFNAEQLCWINVRVRLLPKWPSAATITTTITTTRIIARGRVNEW